MQLDCPNNRYVNDEKICQAVAAMWAKIGVDTKLVTLPRAQYFPKLEKLDTSIYMLGWGGASTDAFFTLQPVLSTHNGKGDGDFNYGRYTNSAEVRRAGQRDQDRDERRQAARADPARARRSTATRSIRCRCIGR